MEKRDELHSSVDAQDMDTIGNQMFDQDDFEFGLENNQLDVDAVFRPGIDTPFSLTAFYDLEMGGSAENRILVDIVEEKENSPPTTLAFERPTRLLHCWKVLQLEKDKKCSWLF